jgi:hypothetical protein
MFYHIAFFMYYNKDIKHKKNALQQLSDVYLYLIIKRQNFSPSDFGLVRPPLILFNMAYE